MGLVISPNVQTRAFGARERPPVSPDFRVPPTSKHLAPSLSVTEKGQGRIRPRLGAFHAIRLVALVMRGPLEGLLPTMRKSLSELLTSN